MTATILQMPTCRFDREFILTGENAMTRAVDEAESLGAAIIARGQRGTGISARLVALAALVAALVATRPADVDDEIYLTSATGKPMRVSLRAVPSFLRAIAEQAATSPVGTA